MGVAYRQGSGVGTGVRESQIVWGILGEVKSEVDKAVAKHAPMNSPHEGSSTIREEFEELWEHVKSDTGTTPEARKEAVQVAAMAVRYILDLISNKE